VKISNDDQANYSFVCPLTSNRQHLSYDGCSMPRLDGCGLTTTIKLVVEICRRGRSNFVWCCWWVSHFTSQPTTELGRVQRRSKHVWAALCAGTSTLSVWSVCSV